MTESEPDMHIVSPNTANDTIQETKIAAKYLMDTIMKRDIKENEDGDGLSSEV